MGYCKETSKFKIESLDVAHCAATEPQLVPASRLPLSGTDARWLRPSSLSVYFKSRKKIYSAILGDCWKLLPLYAWYRFILLQSKELYVVFGRLLNFAVLLKWTVSSTMNPFWMF